MKEKLAMEVVSAEANKEMLETVPHMASEIAEKRTQLQKLDNAEKAKNEQVTDLNSVLYTIKNFEKLTKDKEPTEIISVIKTIVERVIVTQDGDESSVNLKLKGSMDTSYDDFFVCSDTFIDAELGSDELCDSEGCRKLYPYFCRSAIKS